MPAFTGLKRLLGNRIALAAIAIALVAVVIVAVALASGGGGKTEEAVLLPSSTPSPSPSVEPSATLQPQPTATPVIPGTSPTDRLVIGKANVDAPLHTKAVPASGGVLPSPDGPDDVIFYDFAAWDGLGGYPGSGGRIVISGHVDYGGGYCKNGTVPPPCTAVFWDINKLQAGDMIEIRLSSGVQQYRVTSTDNLGATDQAKWDDVWKSTSKESIVLVTCGGDFNRETHEYDKRHVVYGERV